MALISIFRSAKKNFSVGVAHHLEGLNQHSLGNLAKAAYHLKSAIRLIESSIKRYPNITERKRVLSKSYSRLGNIYEDLNDRSNALNYYVSAKNVIESMVRLEFDNYEFQEDLLSVLDILSAFYIRSGALSQAERENRAALLIAEQLVAQDSSELQWQRNLSLIRGKGGLIFKRQGNLVQALEEYQLAMNIAEKIVKRDSSSEFQEHLVLTYFSAGSMFQDLGDLKEALRVFSAAFEIALHMLQGDPSNVHLERGVEEIRERLERVKLAQRT